MTTDIYTSYCTITYVGMLDYLRGPACNESQARCNHGGSGPLLLTSSFAMVFKSCGLTPWKGLEIRPAEFLGPDSSDSGAGMLSPVAVWPLSLMDLPSPLDLEANNDAMVLAIARGPNVCARVACPKTGEGVQVSASYACM